MGDNGIVKENAVHNINKEKYDEGYERIFGKRKKPEPQEKECPSKTESN